MRRGVCPKCGYQTVRHGPAAMYVGTHPSTTTAHVMVPQRVLPTTEASPVDTFLCTYCGYFEQYLVSPAALAFAAHFWAPVPLSG